MSPGRVSLILSLATLLQWGAAQAPSAASTPALPVSYTAVAAGQSGALAGKTFNLAIDVTNWTTDQEIHGLATTLKSNGQDGLLKVMEDMKEIGRVSASTSTGTGIRVARVHPTANGGYHILLVTNRPINVAEVYNSTRSRDYPFGIVSLTLDKSGKGMGQLAPVCQIKFNNKGELDVEHYGQQPFRLMGVRLHK